MSEWLLVYMLVAFVIGVHIRPDLCAPAVQTDGSRL
jgi:hypothetical protein